MSSDIMTDREEKVLDVELRRQLYVLVQKHAGSHFRDLQRLSNLATGTVQYHLEYLVKQELLRSEKDGNQLRYFPKHFTTEHKTLMSFLRQRSVRAILLFIASNDQCIQEEIVKSNHLSASTTSFHIKKLTTAQIITAEKHGRKVSYSLAVSKEELMKLLITYQDTFMDRLVDNMVEMWEN